MTPPLQTRPAAPPATTLLAEVAPSQDELVLRAGGSSNGYWAELWQYRELFFFLAWRDLKVRYKQTAVGVAWAVIRPLLVTAIFVVVFGRLANLPSPDGVPYPLLVLAGMTAWQFFAAVMSDGGNSVIANASLISKVYFPRILVPASVVAVALADLLITGVLTIGLIVCYGFFPPVQVLLLPVFLALALAAALGVGFWLSALIVRYRDVRFIVPFLIQFGLYITPVGFSTVSVPEAYRPLFALNPMVGVIEGFRWCLLGTGEIASGVLPVSTVMAIVLLVTGFKYFRRTERQFADTI